MNRQHTPPASAAGFHLWTVALAASRANGRTREFGVASVAFAATSRAEAQAAGDAQALEAFPPACQWEGHRAVVEQVRPDVVMFVAGGYGQRPAPTPHPAPAADSGTPPCPPQE